MYSDEIKSLVQGYHRFTKNKREEFNQLLEKSQPKALLITCCDFRIDPNLILDAPLGDLFVVRNIANLVPLATEDIGASVGAALEFGITSLKLKDIIVLGHSGCRGIEHLMQSNQKSMVSDWMQKGEKAKNWVEKIYPNVSVSEKQHLCEKRSIVESLNNLKSYSFVNNEICLHGWYFDLDNIQIEAFDLEKKEFKLLC